MTPVWAVTRRPERGRDQQRREHEKQMDKKATRRPPAGPRVAVAQLAPALGDVEANIEAHRQAVARAAEDSVDVLVFPELSLTGYRLKDMVPDVAATRGGVLFSEMEGLSQDVSLVVGLVEEDRAHHFFNAAAYFEAGKLVAVHRKVYLPTYGMFDEQRYFAHGNRIAAFDTRHGRVAILICEDMLHPSALMVAALDGASTIYVPSASPTRGVTAEGEVDGNGRHWEGYNRSMARSLGIHIVHANRTGVEDGHTFWGGSEIVGPEGEPLVKAAYYDPDFVAANLSDDAVRRQRMQSPVLRDEDMDLTINELMRVRGRPDASGGDRRPGSRDAERGGAQRGGYGDRERRGGPGGREQRGGYGDREQRGGYGDRERRGGPGGRDQRGGYGDRERGGGYGDRERRGGPGDRDQRGGYGDRERRGGPGGRDQRDGYGDRERRGGPGGRDQRGGYGDREQRGGYGDRERGGGYGDRERRGGPGGREQRGGYGDRERGGPGDRERRGGPGDRDRGGGYGDRERRGGHGDRDRGGGPGDRDRRGGHGSHDRHDDRGAGAQRERPGKPERGGGDDDRVAPRQRPDKRGRKPRSVDVGRAVVGGDDDGGEDDS